MIVIAIGSVLVIGLAAGIVYQFVGTRRSARLYAPPGMMIDAGGQHRPRQVGADDTPARLDERRGVARGAAPDVDRDTVRHARELAGGKLHQHGIRRRTHETRDGVG